MPLYVYQGLNTGETFELEQRISEAALTHNPTTGEPVKRLIGRPAIAFKGSGFYANDSKSSSSGGSSSVTKTEPSGDAKVEKTADSSTKSSDAPSSSPSAPAPTSSTE
jgi:predicted nucleic acid-binding Zn ribbon protein